MPRTPVTSVLCGFGCVDSCVGAGTMWAAFDISLCGSGVESTPGQQLLERVSGALNGMAPLVNGGSVCAVCLDGDLECSAPVMGELRALICDADIGEHRRPCRGPLVCSSAARSNQCLIVSTCKGSGQLEGIVQHIETAATSVATHTLPAIGLLDPGRRSQCTCEPCQFSSVLRTASSAESMFNGPVFSAAGVVLLDEHFVRAKRPMCELRVMMGALTHPAGEPQPETTGCQPVTPVIVPVVLADDDALAAAYEQHWTPAAVEAARADGVEPATLADLQRLLTLDPIRQDQVWLPRSAPCMTC